MIYCLSLCPEHYRVELMTSTQRNTAGRYDTIIDSIIFISNGKNTKISFLCWLKQQHIFLRYIVTTAVNFLLIHHVPSPGMIGCHV